MSIVHSIISNNCPIYYYDKRVENDQRPDELWKKWSVSAQFQWRLFSITHFLWIYELIDIILVAKPLRQWKPVYYM